MTHVFSALVVVLSVASAASLAAQDRLTTYPGYERYARVSKALPAAVKPGSLQVSWTAPGAFEYVRDGKLYRYDVAARRAMLVGDAPPADASGRRRPERGRQFDSADSPDGTRTAFYRDRNLWISDAGGANERQLTTDGSAEDRIKYGTASWVYGEELGQVTAMWWSPDSRKLAYYRFDESQVPDYYLQLDQTKLQSTIDTEAYPKAGAPNPVVELFVYDLASGTTTRIDVRDGKPFTNDAVGHYVYGIRWAPAHAGSQSPAGNALLFNRTNRRQQIMELVAADPATGEARVIVREEWPTGWADNSPEMRLLADGHRFIWESKRNGWNNFYLYDLSGQLIAPLTAHDTFDAGDLIKIDEASGVLFYTARDGDNPLKVQLHRVGLDGKNHVRLTDPAFHHSVGTCMPASDGRAAANCGISPDSRYFVDVYQTHDTPPATRLADASTGRTMAEVASSDMSTWEQIGLRKAERFTYTATDGMTTLYGLIQFPSDFDPAKRYPVLVQVYGGPESTNARETFVTPNALTEYGFLIVNVESRAAPGRGKRLLDSLYLKLGQTEVDDLAAGVRALWDRPYVDKDRVGVYGTSYGGYAAIMLLLEHPDAFAAAVASSPVTAWEHYDTIYTERYMWMPQENAEGYAAGSAIPRAKNLRGRLMLYWGTADNNVHPSNMMQFIAALQATGKSFDVQVGPDRGHTGINQARMMEFFIENLVLPTSSGVR